MDILRAAMLAAAALALTSCASAPRDTAGEPARDLVHADLPLLAPDRDAVWPRAFADDESFGCESRVAFGTWTLREADGEEARETEWFRMHNYGAFHCFAVVARAETRDALDHAEGAPSFFVLLEDAAPGGARNELWALQIGTRPGSAYLLLARAPEDGVIARFSVLQTACPPASRRSRGAPAGLRTDYCAINDRESLVRFARRMARLPPRGVLVRVPQENEPER